ncbi:MAG: Hpt domain-containing protein [Myxococcota bacterium]
MNQDIIDRSVFDELCATTGVDFVRELASTFIEEAPALLVELRAAHAAQDADAFRRAAHSLKSNALTFGAQRLSEVAREHEKVGLPLGEYQGEEIEQAFAEASAALRGLCDG